MKARVAAYLTDVLRSHGVESLEREAALHTDSVSRLINETLHEHGYDLASFNLDDDRVNQITGRLVEELPGAIRAVGGEREQMRMREYQHGDIARRALLPDLAIDDSAVSLGRMSNDHDDRISNWQSTHTHLRHPDDEFVEQKVNRTIGRLHERALAGTSTLANFDHHQQQHKPAHELSADHREEQARRYILTR